MQYRRAGTPGGAYLFTVNLLERQQDLLIQHIALLRTVAHKVMIAHPFHIDAMVVLPNHLHAVWTLPENGAEFSTRWGLTKARFSVVFRLTNNAMRAVPQKGNGVSGNDASGNT